jgi:uncharacterized lipoprotein YddW (UPF0748 family)
MRRLAAFAAVLLSGVILAAPAHAATTTTEAAVAAPSATTDCATNASTPKRQLRGMWISSVTNIDWPSAPGLSEQTLKDEYDRWLDLAQKLHFNAVFVQVRPAADAFWPSPFEPWSQYLTGVQGKDPGWDPLAWMVAETHSRNIEFHAWFNPYRASMPSPGAGPDISKLADNHPLRQHPDWAVPYPVNAAGSRLYYNPGIPDVRHFVEDAIMDAVTRYDIDGVHFDDYFYPYPAAGQDFGDDATYATYGAGFASKADWRRNNINLLIQEMDQRIHTAKPWVKFGVSPFGIWRNAAADPLGSATGGTQSYDANFADTRLWVKNNWLDYIVPQVYWNIGLAVADYAVLVPWWSQVVAGTQVQLYIGQADYKIATAGQPAQWFDPTEMSRHLTLNESYQVSGDVHFSAVQVRADRIGAVSTYVADHYAKPALIPAMPQLTQGRTPNHPAISDASRDASGAVTLNWHATAQGQPFASVTSYAIYRFDGQAQAQGCDFADASHLLTTVRAGGNGNQSFVDTTAAAGASYTYYVTALDRVWNESNPSPAYPVA